MNVFLRRSRCRLARQWSEPEHVTTGGRSPSGSPSRGTSERCAGSRESVRRCALLRRMWGRNSAGGSAAPSPPSCCGSRSLDGSHSDLNTSRPTWPSDQRRHSPLPYTESYVRTTSTMPSGDRDTIDLEPDRPVMKIYGLSVEPRLMESSTIANTSSSERNPEPLRDNFPTKLHAPYDLLEIAVSETSHSSDSPDRRTLRATPSPSLPPPHLFKPAMTDMNIDEYVSVILVESLNSLTDRLETITASTEGRMSVIEKEIKVKLQNAGVNTVVHLSPTSNHQIIFGNEELCEKDTGAALQRVQSLFLGREVIEDNCHAIDDCDIRFPPPRSLEANPSTAAGGGSPCTSLVDSLDDPSSPRLPLRILSSTSKRPGESDTSRGDKNESFFIRLKDDECDCAKDSLVVADHMPERIKRRLQRRHRRREKHAEIARRNRVRGERSDRGGSSAAVERTCAALVDSLVDDAIGRIAREEYRCARISRRSREEISGISVMRSHERPERRVAPDRAAAPLASSPAPVPAPRCDRGARRLYHKSEIHDGEKCIEILEIVEYANVSRSSSDTASDECVTRGKCRKSRIPVPIPDESRRSRRASAVQTTQPSATPAPVAPEPVAPAPAARRASVPSCEGRLRSDSLRFERVFEVIPEERGALGSESSRSSSGAPADCRSPRRRSTVTTSPSVPPGIAFVCAASSLSRRATTAVSAERQTRLLI